MATRRIKSTVNNKYVQPLKLGTNRKLVVTPSCDYNSILFTNKHRESSINDFNLNVAVKFNTQSFDGIYLMSILTKKAQEVSASDCIFEIYSVSTDGLWTENLVTSISGTVSGNKFISSVPQGVFGSLDLDGELTFGIKCTVNRRGIQFSNKIYANHLGIYDSLFRLKQEVEFLSLTKKDL